MIIDLSFLNPQALSRESWLVRLPGLRTLGTTPASWNAFWVETFDLVTNERPSSCEQLLDEAIPRWNGVPNPYDIAGYVWHGGFTITRATMWRNGFRAVGTGRLAFDRGVTHVRFRVGTRRATAYVIAAYALMFGVGGVAVFIDSIVGTQPMSTGLIGAVMALTPLALFVFAGRTLSRGERRSEEARWLLGTLEKIIGTQELPRA